MNVSIIKHYDCHEIVNRLSTDCHAYPADCHHRAPRFRVSFFKSDHFSRSSLQIRPFRGFWWVFAAYGWVLVGFRSLRLGFQISMLGFSTLRLGFQIAKWQSKLAFTPWKSNKSYRKYSIVWRSVQKFGPAIFLFSHKAGLGYERHFTPSSEVVFKGVKWCSWVPCVSHGLGHEHHLTPWKTTSLEGVKWCS